MVEQHLIKRVMESVRNLSPSSKHLSLPSPPPPMLSHSGLLSHFLAASVRKSNLVRVGVLRPALNKRLHEQRVRTWQPEPPTYRRRRRDVGRGFNLSPSLAVLPPQSALHLRLTANRCSGTILLASDFVLTEGVKLSHKINSN